MLLFHSNLDYKSTLPWTSEHFCLLSCLICAWLKGESYFVYFFSFPLQLRKLGTEGALGSNSQVQKAKQENRAAISEAISESKRELLGFFQLVGLRKISGYSWNIVFCILNKLSLLLSTYRKMKDGVSNWAGKQRRGMCIKATGKGEMVFRDTEIKKGRKKERAGCDVPTVRSLKDETGHLSLHRISLSLSSSFVSSEVCKTADLLC